MKRAWLAFAATLVLVLPARIYTVLRYLDPQSGFYSGGGKWVAAVSVVLALGSAAAAFYGWRDSEAEIRVGGEPFRSVPAAAFGALAGVFVLVQSVVGLGSFETGEGLLFFRIFSGVGIFAGAALLATAYGLATGQRVIGTHPLAALVPTIWGCLFLVFLFILDSSAVNQAENVYHTFTVVFLLLFLFTQAKLLTGIESAKSGKLIYAAGLPAVLLAFSTGIPSCVQFFAAGRTPGAVPIGLHMANIVLAFYIAAFLRALERLPHRPERCGAEPGASRTPAADGRSSEDKISSPDPEDSLTAYTGSLGKLFCSGEKFVNRQKSLFYSKEASEGLQE